MDYNSTTPRTNLSQSNVGSPATYEQQILVTAIITMLGLWSLMGNLLTILAITTRKYMRTKTNVFIMSLAISDLISATTASPLWIYRRTWGFKSWDIGQFACILFWFADESTSYCTTMHIASFAIWRFILIRWPHRLSATKIRAIIIWVVMIWIISIAFGGFFSSFAKAIPKVGPYAAFSHWPMCSLNIFDNGLAKLKAYYTPAIMIFYLVPMSIVIVASLMIVRELYSKSAYKSELRKIKEKRAVLQLGLIASSFMIGYIPITTYTMWTLRTPKKDLLVDYWIGVSAYMMLRLSECINPIAYNISSHKMRKTSMQILKSICCCSLGKDDATSKSHSHISISTRNDTGTGASNIATNRL